MVAQLIPYTPLFVLAAAVAAALAVFGLRVRSDAGTDWFVLMAGAAAGWSLAHALELTVPTLEASLFWNRMAWLPYELVLVGLLLFTLELTGHERWVTRRTLPLLLAWPALTVLLALTSGWHGLLFSDPRLVAVGRGAVDYGTFGPWYWAETAYGFTVALVSAGLFVRQAVARTGLYRKQALVMLAGVASVLAVAVVDIVYAPTPVRLTPISFVPVGALFAWGLVRYRVLDVVPLARDLAVEHMSDAVVVLDVDDRLVDFNPAAAGRFGFDDRDLGAPVASVLDTGPDPGEDPSRQAQVDRPLADGAEFVFDVGTERRYFEVDSVTVRDGRDDPRGRLCLLHDVSERRNRERWLRTLTENASDVILVVGEDGRVRYAGQSVESTLGYDVVDVVGRDVRSLVDPADRDRVRESFTELVGEPDGTRREECRVRHADGSYRTFDVHATNLLADPVVDGVVVNAHDVTERKARERRLRRQNEQLDAFASVVSHDLRNPLNVASGFLELARDSGDPEHFDRVAGAHDRMEEIVTDVLALARAGRDLGDTEPVSLRAVATAAWGHVDTASGSLTVVDDATVEADRTTLLQLFENLFRNAVEHGSTRSPSVRVGTLRSAAGTGGVRGFFVEDDGPGVDADDPESLFEFGTTSSETGTGIGLAVVRSVAEAHSWSVSVEDAGEGTGARFVVVFEPDGDAGDDRRTALGSGDGLESGESQSM
ncbi:histidine kinase N-terminal 7TM domain-containing protein [Halobium salinum]|uniref:histidine kinase n=1 Tax=Halobium salinum TaxID=1364940 RepID=A0ABD5P7U2_9EURY|nr:histidine kinase N-terminal 7TM domain-containing protein [Halobium salinum]